MFEDYFLNFATDFSNQVKENIECSHIYYSEPQLMNIQIGDRSPRWYSG
mgnify:CR=1 FL=1